LRWWDEGWRVKVGVDVDVKVEVEGVEVRRVVQEEIFGCVVG
jgi:hypothetical protein